MTICSADRKSLFGRIVDGKMEFNRLGEMVSDEWKKSGEIRKEVVLDEFVVMPNHFHGIVFLFPEDEDTGDHRDRFKDVDDRRDRYEDASNRHDGIKDAGDRRSPLHPVGPAKKSLGALIAGFKAACTRRAREMTGKPDFEIWQRSYYDHVIRNERDLAALREYIDNNPLKWELDRYYADAV